MRRNISGTKKSRTFSGRFRLALTLALALLSWHAAGPGDAMAGPPFVTDDPETVEFRHWEFYVASQFGYRKGEIGGTAPHVEANFGVLPDVQLHVLAPVVYSITRGHEADFRVAPPYAYDRNKWNRAKFGYGYTEIGMKVRFLHESDGSPQIGIFPMIEAPTATKGMGYNFLPQLYLPLFIQKSAGDFTTYGGGGFWYNPGKDNRNYWFAGWLVQYKFAKRFTLVAECFYYSPDSKGAEHRAAANIGMIVDFNDTWHLLFSAGRDILGPNILSAYLAVQCTVGD